MTLAAVGSSERWRRWLWTSEWVPEDARGSASGKPGKQRGNADARRQRLVNEAVARAEARVKSSQAPDSKPQAKLVSTHPADLAAAKSQMRAEQKAMLAKAQSSQTIRNGSLRRTTTATAW